MAPRASVMTKLKDRGSGASVFLRHFKRSPAGKANMVSSRASASRRGSSSSGNTSVATLRSAALQQPCPPRYLAQTLTQSPKLFPLLQSVPRPPWPTNTCPGGGCSPRVRFTTPTSRSAGGASTTKPGWSGSARRYARYSASPPAFRFASAPVTVRSTIVKPPSAAARCRLAAGRIAIWRM